MTDPSSSKKRTDEIRQRRLHQEQMTQKGRRNTRRKVTMPSTPPVMARSAQLGTPSISNTIGNKKSNRSVKRRFDFALSIPGAEMRLPIFPQIHFGWRAASFILTIFLGFMLYHLWTSPLYRVDIPDVSGLKNLNFSDINSVIDVNGKSVFEVDAGQMQQKLVDAFPEFSSVSVIVELPQTVAISVTERTPVLVWQQGGLSKLVDAEGVTFPFRDNQVLNTYPTIYAQGDPPEIHLPKLDDYSLEIPGMDFLTGEYPLDLPISGKAEPFLLPEMVAAILEIANEAPSGSKLIYDPTIGLGWIDQRGWDVYIGNVEDLKMKLSVYDAILEHLKAADTRPEIINVAFVHAPYYRLQQ